MKTDSELQYQVEEALRLSPDVTHINIGVSVYDGVVSLNGHVPSFREKCEAEKAAQSVMGVKAVAEKIEIRLTSDFFDHDERIGRDAYDALARNPQVPADVRIKVEKGWITLSGEVHSEIQKEAAANTVLGLSGITGIFNQISVAPHPPEVGPVVYEGDPTWKRD